MLIEKFLLHAGHIALKKHLAVHCHIGELLEDDCVVHRLGS